MLVNNVWISASAGSGKTKALTDCTLQLLLAGIDPAKILCLTYTKAAAAEMLQRITLELRNWIILGDDDLTAQISMLTGKAPDAAVINLARTALIRILDTRNTIKIQTIHAFCQSILAKFPIESGLGLNTKIIDDYQKQALLKQTKLDVLRDQGELGKLQPLLVNIHELSFDSLIEEAISHRSKIHDLGGNEDVYKRLLAAFSLDPALSAEQLFAQFATDLNRLINDNMQVLQALSEHSFIIKILDFAAANNEQKQRSFMDFYEAFYTSDHSPRKTLVSNKIVMQYQLENFIAEIRILVAQYIESRNSYKIAEYSTSFFHLVRLVDHHYEKLKTEKSLLDYDDLINITLRILASEQLMPWIMFKLDGKVEHILIDESQDISAKQWQIIIAITENFFCELGQNNQPRTIFAVGDQKQSIFSFQGANPKLFNEIKNYYHQHTQNFNATLQSITLNKSFRSGAAILRVVDETFKLLTSRDPDAFIEQQLEHIAHKNIDSRVELWPAVLCKKSEKPDDYTWQIHTSALEVYDPSRILSKLIASEIKGWIGSGTQPGDILILIRKRDKFTEHLIRALKENDIPVSGLDRIKLKQNIVIKDLLALANFILLPHDDYNLACLLKSPLINFSEKELLELSQLDGDSWWDRIMQWSSTGHLLTAFTFLNNLLHNNALHTPYQLFSHILDTLALRHNIVARFGTQINEILDEFLQICWEYEQSDGLSLQKFSQWFDSTNIEIKRDIDNQANIVRIMTIHASKGLQAKTVILVDSINKPKIHQKTVWSEDLELPLYNGNKLNNNRVYNGALDSCITKMMQEYYRLLYVAMTRAEERLIICGWNTRDSIAEGSWYDIIQNTMQNMDQPIPCPALGGYQVIPLADNEEGTDGNYFHSVNAVRYSHSRV